MQHQKKVKAIRMRGADDAHLYKENAISPRVRIVYNK